MALLLVGCGGGGGTTASGTANTLHESTACIGCHDADSWITPGTRKPLVPEWKNSTHMTANGAGCVDCHDDGYMHPASCTRCHNVGAQSRNPSNNPDQDGKCAKCHDSTKGFDNKREYDGIIQNTLTEHFSTPTLASYTSPSNFKARYVTKNYQNSCRSCHNPHDTATAMEKFRQWSRSGKGNVSAAPWSSRDFRLSGTALPATPATSYGNECVRCHTSTGFIAYLKNKTIAPFGGPSKTEGREVLACNACHDDGSGYAYSYKVRSVGQVTAYYNLSTTQAGIRYRIRIPEIYENVNTSNVCVACHVGREIGEVIKQAATQGLNFANTAFISSHYLTGGATIFQTSGYEFPGKTYPSGTGEPNSYLHRKVGVGNDRGTGSDGPCVTCHLKPGRHTFLPVTLTELVPPETSLWTRHVTAIVSPECIKCHNFITTQPLDSAKMNDLKEGFFQTTEVLRLKLAANNMFYRSGGMFTTLTGNTRVTNWVKFGTGSGPNTMGAAFNYVLLANDYGAYAHNSYYGKRLLYDSIDMLDDGQLNDTTCTTISTNAMAFKYLCKSSTSTGRP
jgi:hypothetical protein